MPVSHVPVDDIFAAHKIAGPWQPLEATGVANRIYATRDVVLRVATDHAEAIPDAYTESVAAPFARQAGILTPELIAFDDSRVLVDRPYSLWERVHGVTFGLADLQGSARRNVWCEVGHQIALLHSTLRECPDPCGYLDTPGRETQLEAELRQLADSGHASRSVIAEIEDLISLLTPVISQSLVARCFVHNDLHDLNIMCGSTGGLLALIDWGDAGWGDPALDLAAVPLDEISAVLEGYGKSEKLGLNWEARVVWDHLHQALEKTIDDLAFVVPVVDYRRFLTASR